MLRALLQQQFPRANVKGVADAENTGNFVVRDENTRDIISPYGFFSTIERQRLLLDEIAQRYAPIKN